jgi:hypothetical protein
MLNNPELYSGQHDIKCEGHCVPIKLMNEVNKLGLIYVDALR